MIHILSNFYEATFLNFLSEHVNMLLERTFVCVCVLDVIPETKNTLSTWELLYCINILTVFLK